MYRGKGNINLSDFINFDEDKFEKLNYIVKRGDRGGTVVGFKYEADANDYINKWTKTYNEPCKLYKLGEI